MREYEKRGKSKKYCELKDVFQQKMDKEILKYTEKVIDDVKNGNKNCTYSALRKLGVRPGKFKHFQSAITRGKQFYCQPIS